MDWSKRVYKTEPLIWGGSPDCNHNWDTHITPKSRGSTDLTRQSRIESVGMKPLKSAFCSLCRAWRGDLGLEPLIGMYVSHLCDIFDEVKRVLRDDGALWLNIGDTYYGGGSGHKDTGKLAIPPLAYHGGDMRPTSVGRELPKKCLSGVPERVMLEMMNRGWILRQKIIWCLSGGTYIYARTQNGIRPVMVRDIGRATDPTTFQLWNGREWTNVVGISKSQRRGDEVELVLRSGERISCTPTHRFPTIRGLLKASEIKLGDILESTKLPDVDSPKDCALDEDAAWFAGLYIAEGSHSNESVIQIAGHSKEMKRWEHLQRIAKKYGGSITRTIDGNSMSVRMYGKVLNAILNEFVSGRTSRSKGFSTVVWNYSNRFIEAMLDGYLAGDGYWDGKNNRWRLGFIRNYNLERDLRTACARLGYKLILKTSTVNYDGYNRPTFRGEIRKEVSEHRNNKHPEEVVEIRKARCRDLYDIGVEDVPHLFSLSSGILTHNSKPNAIPESTNDRPTTDWEYLYLFVKNNKSLYWTNLKRKQLTTSKPHGTKGVEGLDWEWRTSPTSGKKYKKTFWKSHDYYYERQFEPYAKPLNRWGGDKLKADGVDTWSKGTGQSIYREREMRPDSRGRRKRSVWSINTKPFNGSHFAIMPEELCITPILATCPKSICTRCNMPRIILNDRIRLKDPRIYGKKSKELYEHKGTGLRVDDWKIEYIGYTDCGCNAPYRKGIVLDPFAGAGTTLKVARDLGRDYVGIELNPDYVKIAEKRLNENPKEKNARKKILKGENQTVLDEWIE